MFKYFILFILLFLFSCKSKDKDFQNIKDISYHTELIILNQTLKVNDSILLQFKSNQDQFFFIKSDILNQIHTNNNTENYLTIYFLNDKSEILNNIKIREKEFDQIENVYDFNKINCDKKNSIEITSNHIIKIKGLENEDLKDFNEQINIYIEYDTNINTTMKCISEKYKKEITEGKLKVFTGKLKSNLVKLNYAKA